MGVHRIRRKDMNINPVTFGKKIPIAKCHIKDVEQGKFVPATFYEIDCTDINDNNEIYDLKDWAFRITIAQDIRNKYDYIQKFGHPNSIRIFEMQTDEDKQIVGLCDISDLFSRVNLDFIVSSPDKKHKYVGQSMIAILGDIANTYKHKKIYIPNPIKKAEEFYKNICGFKKCSDSEAMYMSKRHYTKFKKSVEQKTNSPIISCTG